MRLIKKTKFEKFYYELGKKIGCQHYVSKDFGTIIGGTTIDNENYEYQYEHKGLIELIDKDYRLILTQINPHLIELHKIEIPKKNRGNGVGTDIMNKLLDLIEEHELSLRLVPTYYLDTPFTVPINQVTERLHFQSIRNGSLNKKDLKTYKQLIKKDCKLRMKMSQKLIEFYESFGFTRTNPNSPFYIYENEYSQLVA